MVAEIGGGAVEAGDPVGGGVALTAGEKSEGGLRGSTGRAGRDGCDGVVAHDSVGGFPCCQGGCWCLGNGI